MNLLRSLLLVSTAIYLTGCPADVDVAPAFVNFAGFNLETPEIGPATSDITEVWVFADQDFLGAFPLPARIPVLRAGATTLRFLPGIRQNGNSITPDIYAFYTEVTRTLELVPGQTVDVGISRITYKPEVQFPIIEDFEQGRDRVFTIRVAGDTTFTASQDQVRSGNFSGKISLTEASPEIEFASAEVFRNVLPEAQSVWLEIDFLSDAFLNYGISGVSQGSLVRNFDPISRPRNEWTKIYFNLTEVIVQSRLDEFQLNIAALLPEGVAVGDVYLDNIKMLHF